MDEYSNDIHFVSSLWETYGDKIQFYQEGNLNKAKENIQV